MKARKVIITKEVWTDKTINAVKEWELARTMHSEYQVKQVQVNVVKEGEKA